MNTRVLYAADDDGADLAVIDVTHSAFAVTATEAEVAAMGDRHLIELTQHVEMPPAVQEALERSHLGRGLRAAAGSFLAGMHTYLLKLGPEYLGEAETNPIDRYIAGSFPAFALRVRLQDMARLLANGLARIALTEPRRQICLINIAGGPASDSWNALILLRTEVGATQPGLLEGREIVVAVMDLDEVGPAFGARAISALRAPAAPLSGLDVQVRHLRYEWSDVGRLRQLLGELHAAEAACAISSEGGLFEYGSDAEIVSNLGVLHAGTASDAILVGSVTRDGELMRVSQKIHRISLRPRTMEAFQALAEEAGWTVEHVIHRPLSYHVSLAKR